MNIFKSFTRLVCCLIIFLLLSGQASYAIDPNTLPTGYQSVAGNVGFSQVGNNVLNITTGANSSIANFDTFSVGSNATVNISQPGNNSFLLGKVLGGSLSQIDGTIAGTGNFFLLNPAGVLLSRTASINLNSFLASTLNITNQDFLNGNFVFRALNGIPTGAIVNDGLINASSSVVFLGNAIKNTGTINAGQVHLAVGEHVTLVLGNNIVSNVIVDEPLKDKVQGYQDAILNSGMIKGSSGVSLQAKTQGALYQTLVKNSGGSANEAVIEGGNVKFVARTFQPLTDPDTGNTTYEATNEGLMKNGGNVSSTDLEVSAGILENTGTLQASSDGTISLTGSKTATVANADGTVVHNPGGQPTGRASTERISYSLFNNTGIIEAGHNLSIDSTNGGIRNRNGKIEALNNLYLTAPEVVNELAGFGTAYRDEDKRIGNANHHFDYWTDVAPSAEATIKAGNDLAINAGQTLNKSGEIAAGHDLTVLGDDLVNDNKVLQSTTHESWVRGGTRRTTRHAWSGGSLDSTSGEITADNDILLGLNGDLTNRGLIEAGNNLQIGSQNFINGLLDERVRTPKTGILPGSIFGKNISIVTDQLLNTGLIQADQDIWLKARRIQNRMRTAKNIENVMVHRGLFKGSQMQQIAYDELQPGGAIVGGWHVSLIGDEEVRNTGGTIATGELLDIKAPNIVNEVAEGSRVVTWDAGNLGRMLGKKNWGYASVYSPGVLSSGGEISLKADTVLNRGSDILGFGDVKIQAGQLVEQNWVASHYTSGDKLSFSGLKIKRDKITEHVTRSSTIGSETGNVEVETGGTFRNIASDVSAGNDIKIKAQEVDIRDGIHQSTDQHTSSELKFRPPVTASLEFQDTKLTHTTQRSSNFAAGNNLGIESHGNLTVTGSNLAAGEQVNLTGQNVIVQNGLYTDTNKTQGGSASAGLGIGTINFGVSMFQADGSAQTLTQSNLSAKEINVLGSKSVGIKSSNLTASDKLEITTPKLDITGEYERQAYKSQSNSVGVSVTLPQFAAISAVANTALSTVLSKVAPNQAAAGGSKGGIGVSYSQSNSHNNSGEYIESNLSAPHLVLNSPSQHINGAVINGQEINPSNNHDYQDKGSSSFGFGIGTGGVNASVGFGDHSFGLGFGNGSLFGSVGYGQFNIGTSFKPGANNRLGLFGGGYGAGVSAGFGSSGFDAGASYGPLGIGGTLQDGHLKIGGTAGFWNFDLVDYAKGGNQLPIQQNAERVELIDQTLIAVDKVRSTQNLSPNELEALDEIEQQLKAAKTMELVYGTDDSRKISNTLIGSASNLIPSKLPDEALQEMGISAQRLRLEAFHDTYGKLAMVPIIGSTFGLIDAFVYANQGTAYPQLNGVGIKNEPGKAAVSVLSSLPFPGVPGKGSIKAGEEILEGAVKYGDDIYKIAQQGGKYSGQLKQFEKWPNVKLQKSISSFEKNIEKHKAWIKNPESKISEWSTFSQKYRDNMIHHWENDIQRAEAYKVIAERVIKIRGE
jgi:filamentous hemagglutinin family protein